MVYANGGGAFLIPYFVSLIAVGIPIMLLELGMGHSTNGSAPLALRRVSKNSEWVGWIAVGSGFIITTYYAVIIAWAMNYIVKSFTLGWGQDPNAHFFGEFLQLSGSPGAFETIVPGIIVATALVWAINYIIVASGVEGGLEKANKIFMPILLVLMAVLVVRGLTLPGGLEGINWYLTPDFGALTDPTLWLMALSQIFFTLSLGFGIMMAYGSYLPKDADITNNAFLVSLLNCGFSFFAGFAIFSMVGYMAQETGSAFDQVVTESIGLAFVAFPQAINLIPAGSQIIGAIFFIALTIAGFSSAVSLVEAVSSSVMDKFGMARKKAVGLVVGVSLLISILYTTHAGLLWLDMIDYFANRSLPLVGLVEGLLVVWLLGGEKLVAYANQLSEIKLSPTMTSVWKFFAGVFAPVILILTLGNKAINFVNEPYGGYPLKYLGIALGVVLLIAYVLGGIISMSEWKSEVLSWGDYVRQRDNVDLEEEI